MIGPEFMSLGTKPAKTAVITLGTQPMAIKAKPIMNDRIRGAVSSNANSWTIGLTRISPQPVMKYGMKVHHPLMSLMGYPPPGEQDASNTFVWFMPLGSV